MEITKDKNVVAHFRLLNNHSMHRNTAISFFKDTCDILANSKCKTLTYIETKVTFHWIPLHPKSKEYYEILSHLESLTIDISYAYGLPKSPA